MKANLFPKFMTNPRNAVRGAPAGSGLQGFLFEGAEGTQIVLWQGRRGGTSPLHTHTYDEYAIVVQGTFKGTVGGKAIVLKPGDECFIPAGTPHAGKYSANYRAIDAFGGRRVQRIRRK
jgi:quercetin dioxygenase-like cupin family protein